MVTNLMSHHYTVHIKDHDDIIFGYNKYSESYEFTHKELVSEYQAASYQDAYELVTRLYPKAPASMFVFTQVERPKYILVYNLPFKVHNSSYTITTRYVLQSDSSLMHSAHSTNARKFNSKTEALNAAIAYGILRDSYVIEEITEEF